MVVYNAGDKVRMTASELLGLRGIVVAGPTKSGGYKIRGVFVGTSTFWPDEFELVQG